MKYKINDLVSEIKYPEIEGRITAIFKNYEEYCMTDISMYEKSKKALEFFEEKPTEEELNEIQYSVFWGEENGQSLHCESRLILVKCQQ